MTKEEFLKKAEEIEDWSPGWDAIDKEFERLYPGQEPQHYGTMLLSRATFGGDEYLDGYSIYTSPKGYMHIVTYGMTELYVDEELFGGEWNNWGYEMTMKLKEPDAEHCRWALQMLGNLARYTYKTEKFFEPYQYVAGNDNNSLHIGEESEITALVIIPDTEAQTQDTVYGKTEFLQLVGVTTKEIMAIRNNPDRVHELIEKMREDNPDFVTDMKRTKSYIE